ncbi:MAG: hypothetical protein ACYDH5_06655 [Acidimicrobiales bacterium]
MAVVASATPAWAGPNGTGQASDNPAAGTATALATSSSPAPAGPAAVTPSRGLPAPGIAAALAAPAPVAHYCSSLGPAGSVVNQELGPGGAGPGTWTGYLCATGDVLPTGAMPYRYALRGNISAPSFMLAWSPKSAVPGVAPVVKVIVVNPTVLVSRAQRSIRVPSPGPIGLSPGGSGWTVPQFATWLWVDPAAWRPVTARASAAGVSAVVTATPSRVRWDMGDGSVTTCAGPGTPYDPARPASAQSSSCTWTYRHHTGAMTVSATITWTVTWTVSGASGGARSGKLAPLSSSASRRRAGRPVESLVSGG